MAEAEKSKKYKVLREDLIGLILTINEVIPLEEREQVLILMKLNTEEKIVKFNEWVKARLKGENDLDATAAEIVRAAVQIDRESQQQ